MLIYLMYSHLVNWLYYFNVATFLIKMLVIMTCILDLPALYIKCRDNCKEKTVDIVT